MEVTHERLQWIAIGMAIVGNNDQFRRLQRMPSQSWYGSARTLWATLRDGKFATDRQATYETFARILGVCRRDGETLGVAIERRLSELGDQIRYRELIGMWDVANRLGGTQAMEAQILAEADAIQKRKAKETSV